MQAKEGECTQGLSGSGRSPCVLIVDDNRDFAENIAEVVEQLGFEVDAVSSGAEAFARIQAKSYQVAVVDIQLPDVSGTRVIARIKEEQPDCACIVFTGNATLRNAVDALNHGAFAYLTKGGEAGEFRAVLRNAIKANSNSVQLRQIREINAAILSNFPGRMLILDAEGHVVLANMEQDTPEETRGPARVLESWSGRQIEEVLGRDSPLCKFVIEHSRGMIGATKPRVFSRQSVSGPDVEPTYFDIRFVPLFHSLARLLVVVEDVTQEVRMEGEMEKKSRLAAVGELAATIAHEVRNSLSGISGAIQILKKRLPSTDTGREICDKVMDQVDRLNNTIEDLLVLSRPMTPKLTEVLLSDFIDSAVSFLRDDPNFKSILIQVQNKGGDPISIIDPFLLRQAFINVLINAGHAMGGRGVIQILTFSNAKESRIVIEDSGPGFPPNASRLFEPFYTTKPGGSGLGLPITAKILEVHQGKVLLRNHERGGGEVTFVIPNSPLTKRRGPGS